MRSRDRRRECPPSGGPCRTLSAVFPDPSPQTPTRRSRDPSSRSASSRSSKFSSAPTSPLNSRSAPRSSRSATSRSEPPDNSRSPSSSGCRSSTPSCSSGSSCCFCTRTGRVHARCSSGGAASRAKSLTAFPLTLVALGLGCRRAARDSERSCRGCTACTENPLAGLLRSPRDAWLFALVVLVAGRRARRDSARVPAASLRGLARRGRGRRDCHQRGVRRRTPAAGLRRRDRHGIAGRVLGRRLPAAAIGGGADGEPRRHSTCCRSCSSSRCGLARLRLQAWASARLSEPGQSTGPPDRDR